MVVQIISKSKPTHDRGQMIEDKSNQHMIDKTPIENKIPTRRKDTKKRIILD